MAYVHTDVAHLRFPRKGVSPAKTALNGSIGTEATGRVNVGTTLQPNRYARQRRESDLSAGRAALVAETRLPDLKVGELLVQSAAFTFIMKRSHNAPHP